MKIHSFKLSKFLVIQSAECQSFKFSRSQFFEVSYSQRFILSKFQTLLMFSVDIDPILPKSHFMFSTLLYGSLGVFGSVRHHQCGCRGGNRYEKGDSEIWQKTIN